MYFERDIKLPDLLNKKSFFLFGPRGTGKTRLFRETLGKAKVYDLLHAPTFDRLVRRPTLIGEERQDDEQIVVIDEIQKLPRLLDEVHRLIEERQIRFLMTGSSARKLRRGAANLLAGRAWEARLFPLCFAERGSVDLTLCLLQGGLPAVVNSDDPWEELRAYSGTYLKEEIIAEAAVRKLDQFVTFLDLAASKTGEELNFASLASDSGINARTLQNFFELLEDTLVGFRLLPFRRTVRRKAVSRMKFYLFDLGVTSSLVGRRELVPHTDAYGRAFEHFIALELRAYLHYRRRDWPLQFWRTHGGYEVDFVIGNKLALEIKSTELVHERHLKGLRALREEQLVQTYAVVSHDPEERVVDGVHIYPWETFLRRLWSDQLL